MPSPSQDDAALSVESPLSSSPRSSATASLTQGALFAMSPRPKLAQVFNRRGTVSPGEGGVRSRAGTLVDESDGKVVSIRLALEEEEERALSTLPEETRPAPRKHTSLCASLSLGLYASNSLQATRKELLISVFKVIISLALHCVNREA